MNMLLRLFPHLPSNKMQLYDFDTFSVLKPRVKYGTWNELDLNNVSVILLRVWSCPDEQGYRASNV